VHSSSLVPSKELAAPEGHTETDTTKGLLIALTCLLASACASTPKSYMLVPSRTTVPELEKLSRQSGTTVDVLTVNREERRFLLDAGDGAALTGHDLDVRRRRRVRIRWCGFLWKSTDYGDTFTRIDRAPGAPAGVYLGFSGQTVTVDPHHHRTVDFPDSGNVGGLWRSLDAGNTWTEVDASDNFLSVTVDLQHPCS
jgi:hypothetical protein